MVSKVVYKIDINSEDGNIFFAMGKARQYLNDIGKLEESKELLSKVLETETYPEACQMITEITDGAMVFYNSREK